MAKSLSVQILEDFGEIRRYINIIALRDLRPLGLGQKQAMILRCLAKNPNSSLADLSRFTMSDPAAVTRAIDSLEKSEWIVKQEHPSDRRRWVLALTPAGKKQISALDELVKNISSTMTDSLSKTELEALAKIFAKMKTPLGEITEGQTVVEED